MLKLAAFTITILAGTSAGVVASASGASPGASQDPSKVVCKYVLSAQPGAEPYKLCQSNAQWQALEDAYAKDANRMVCHYEDMPGTKINGHKVCGPLSAWKDRQAEAREATETIQRGVCVPGGGC